MDAALPPNRVFPDANLFVAAVRHPARLSGTLRLLYHLIENAEVELVGDPLLLEEFERYAEAFASPMAAQVLHSLAQRMTIVEPQERFLVACLGFMHTKNPWDVVHAATCLETGATLISNDRDFDAIAKAGIIHRLTLAEAIGVFL